MQSKLDHIEALRTDPYWRRLARANGARQEFDLDEALGRAAEVAVKDLPEDHPCPRAWLNIVVIQSATAT